MGIAGSGRCGHGRVVPLCVDFGAVPVMMGWWVAEQRGSPCRSAGWPPALPS